MRMFVKVTIPVENGNHAISNGSLHTHLKSILEELKPEASYFIEEGGKRTALLFVDMADPSKIPAIAEPFFLAFNAQVEIRPAMVIEDLMKAGPAMESAVKKYHRSPELVGR
jgi:hypothetical protein